MQQPDPHQSRSAIMQELYPDELMTQTFGTVAPSSSERASYFFMKWCDWKDNTLKLSDNTRTADVLKICREMGLRYLWDFQIRGFFIRFCDAQSLAFFKIATAQGVNNV